MMYTRRATERRARIFAVLFTLVLVTLLLVLAPFARIDHHVAISRALTFETMPLPPPPALAAVVAEAPAPTATPTVTRVELPEIFSTPVRTELSVDLASTSPPTQAPLSLSRTSVDIPLVSAPAGDIPLTQRVSTDRAFPAFDAPVLTPIEGGIEYSGERAEAVSGIADIEVREEAEGSLSLLPPSRSEPSISVDVAEILQWAQLHPSPLPPGIRQLTGYRDGNITSRITLQGAAKSYELFLLVRPEQMEVHVVLVDGDALFYLVDARFQRTGELFRRGQVVRDGTGEITTAMSEDLPASTSSAQEFYRRFLDWWDQERMNL